MAVRFILGRAGAGKTQWCVDRIVESMRSEPLGPAIYWILPRQATFQAERQLACSGGMGGYFRARVLSFEDFGKEILAESGGAAVAEITDRGRRMILGHILRQLRDQLRFFQSVVHQPGVAAELDDTFAELERSRQDIAEIDTQLTQAADPINPGLSAKIHDLALIQGEYLRFLGQDRLDPTRRLSDALSAVERCHSLRRAEVFIDSFFDFTASERGIIAALGKTCRSVSITVTIDPQSPCIANPHCIPDEMSLFHRGEETYRRVFFSLREQSVSVGEPILLKEPRRFKNARLVSLEKWEGSPSPATRSDTTLTPTPDRVGTFSPDRVGTFSPDRVGTFSLSQSTGRGGKEEGTGTIEMIEAPDPRAEVDAAARWIRGLTAGSMRYREIAVLMRSQEDYRSIIEASFAEHGIPFFVDRRRTASHHPLLRLIRAALAVATNNWSHEAMMAVIKTGLVGLSHADADALENYVLQHGISHKTWTIAQPWTGRRRGGDESGDAPGATADAGRMDVLRRGLVDRLAPFVSEATRSETSVRALAAAIFAMLEAFDCRGQIVQWMDRAAERGHLEERGEHERVWEELVEMFDELVDLFGREPISLKDFIAIVDSALEGFDLALTPPTVDQVLVGAVDRTRTPAIRACVVLGLSEGQFPRMSREGSLFSDADRRVLGRRNIDLDPDTARRLLDEEFLGYVAFTRASERLLLTRSSADEKAKPLSPSPLWTRVVERFDDLSIVQAPREEELKPDLIATPRQLICALMRWVRGGDADPTWAAVYQWLARRAPSGDAVDIARYRAWKALSDHNEAHLDADVAKALFASPLSASIPQLESFRACPYQHFARYGLGLKKREKSDVSGADLSRIYHEVLERLVVEMIRGGGAWVELDDAETRRRISQLTGELGARIREELMLSTARNRYLLSHIEKTLGLAASAQKGAGQRGEFRPKFTNVRFDEGEKVPPLAVRTPGGNQALIRGKIDRVDLLSDGSACAIDYRLATGRLEAARMFHGLSLQLLVYLLVLERNGRQLAGSGEIIPAAAFWVQTLRKMERKNPREATGPDDPDFHLAVKPRGIFDIRVARNLDKHLADGWSKVVQVHIKRDGAMGNINSADAAGSEEFAALLRHVERRIGRLADEIIAGRIEIRPFRHGNTTACARCEFAALCRFEPAPRAYDEVPGMNREELFGKLRE
jgi:ATP-dependent helicase/nuclease subunit B